MPVFCFFPEQNFLKAIFSEFCIEKTNLFISLYITSKKEFFMQKSYATYTNFQFSLCAP